MSDVRYKNNLCAECLAIFAPPDKPCCRRCCLPLAQGTKPAEDCLRCRGERFHFDRALMVGFYQSDLREAVLAMKKATREPLALAVGRILAGRITDNLAISDYDLLVPIPMHWTRRLQRGTNAPEVLVESMKGRVAVRAALDLLYYRRKTKKQGTLKPAARFENVRGAFGVSAGYDIKGANILVIDDVMTTGATTNEAAKVLRQAGAERVTVAVVARGGAS